MRRERKGGGEEKKGERRETDGRVGYNSSKTDDKATDSLTNGWRACWGSVLRAVSRGRVGVTLRRKQNGNSVSNMNSEMRK